MPQTFLSFAYEAIVFWINLTCIDGREFLEGPVVGFFDFWWKHAAWKLPSFQMIAYTFAALTLPVAWYVGAPAVLRVNLHVGTRLSLNHLENHTSFSILEEKSIYR